MQAAVSKHRYYAWVATPIAKCLLLSLLFHGFLVGGLEFYLQATQRRSLFSSFSKLAEIAREAEDARQNPPELLFVEVDPAAAAEEPPKDTKFYSAVNTRAANPKPKQDRPTPKVEGKQKESPKVIQDSPLKAEPLQPAPAPPAPRPVETKPPVQPEPKKIDEEARPPQETKSAPPGDLAMARPSPQPSERIEKPVIGVQPDNRPAPRPRTLAQARQMKGIPGPVMQQEGGVSRHSLESNLDVKATPFGAYDAAFIAAVRTRWYDLLDERDFVRNETGKVVLEFRLHSDGRISTMAVTSSEVSDTLIYLCQRAILDPAKYAPFPQDLRRMLGKEYRDVRFTFHYN